MTTRRLLTRIALATFILALLFSLGTLEPAQAAALPLALPVTITGTPNVNVANPASAPALTRDVDNPARQPVQVHLSESGTGHGPLTLFASGYPVPSGKRLVIEYVASQVLIENVSAGQAQLKVRVASPGGLAELPIGAAFTGFQCDLSDDFCYTISSPVRIYAEAGSTIILESFINVPGATDQNVGLDAYFTGYLVNVP